MHKIIFKDRVSKFPNRKKLKIVSQSAGEIVADVVEADSPQVEGTKIDAKILNNWQDVIFEAEGNAKLARTKVAEATENANNALEISKSAKDLAGKAVELAKNIDTSVANLFVPIKTSDIFNDNKYVSAGKVQAFTAEEKEQARLNLGLGCGEFSGSYNELTDKPQIPTKCSDLNNDAGFVTNQVSDLVNYSIKNKTATGFNLSLDENTYVLSIELTNEAGESLGAKSVDLPVESLVASASYANHTLTLTLKNGNTIDIDVSSLISGLVPENRKVNGKELTADINLTKEDVGVVVDDELSDSSENLVKNRVVTEKLTELETGKADKESVNSSVNTLTNLFATKLDKEGAWELIIDDKITTTAVSSVNFLSVFDFYNYDYKIEYAACTEGAFPSTAIVLKFINSAGDVVTVSQTAWSRYNQSQNYTYSGGTQEGTFTPGAYGFSKTNQTIIDWGMDPNDGSGPVLYSGEFIPTFDIYNNRCISFKSTHTRDSFWCQQFYMYAGIVTLESENINITGFNLTEQKNVKFKVGRNHIRVYKKRGGWNKFLDLGEEDVN